MGTYSQCKIARALPIELRATHWAEALPTEQQRPKIYVLRPVLIQIDSSSLQTGFYHCSVDFYHGYDVIDVGKRAILGEKCIKPYIHMQINSLRVLRIYGQFYEKFENS